MNSRQPSKARRRVSNRLIAMFSPPVLGPQGQHRDPEISPRPDARQQSDDRNSTSEAIHVLRECITLPGETPRSSILRELADFHAETIEQSYHKCIHWEQMSVDEWSETARSSSDGLRDFYNTTTSWRYDLAWHAYLQSEGYAFPQALAVNEFLLAGNIKGRLLEFGSGIGVNAQVFRRLGYQVTIADVSRTLLDYATWRFERHGDAIAAIDLNITDLPRDAFEIATALDVLVHVPDVGKTARDLHAALADGGWLLANFDVREEAPETAWHLHGNRFVLEHSLQQAGFVKRETVGGFLGCYQKVDPKSPGHRLRMALQRAAMPARHAIRFVQRSRLGRSRSRGAGDPIS